MNEQGLRLAVILVTYNRLACLKIALEKYDQQTMPPKYILVVDNASNDGTKEYLAQWKSVTTDKYQKMVIRLSENTGGSGGFNRGMEEGLKLDCDFLFLADDDAYAEPDVFEKLNMAYQNMTDKRISALCTAILNHDKYEVGHRCLIKKGPFRVSLKFSTPKEYRQDNFKVDVLTFVGAAISKEAAKAIGLPKKEYFIYFDDTEYSLRLKAVGEIYCVSSSVMHHDIGKDRRSSWKDYYDTRNWIDMIHMHFSKRYYYVAIIEKYIRRCTVLASIFRSRSKEHRRMCRDAIKDAVNLRLGKNEKYMPKKQD